ncbi:MULTISPECIES: hypothetical protein [unclassified Halomonas]|uniref:hypothetical protein n=1 Tax=unclassified Halomonas TaxID=2609666 RepID=UPI002076A1AC|nr:MULTISPECIES: hypothetical protein [unclassified Halomonas]
MEEHRKLCAIPDGHTLRQVNMTWKQKSGWDKDTWIYEEVDASGNVVARHEVVDETCMYPPFENVMRHRIL